MMHYRKLLAFLLACGLCAGAAQSLPQEVLDVRAAERVTDTFEQNYDGWHPNTDHAVLTALNGLGENGSRGMLVSKRQSPKDGAASSKGLYLGGGKAYTYQIAVYSETDEHFHLTLRYVDAQTDAETVVELTSQDVRAGEWTTLSKRFTAPENSYEFELTLTTDSTNDFRFDNVSVTEQVYGLQAEAAPEGKGLKDEFANYFQVGNILNGATIHNSEITGLFLREYNVVECENETKPDATMRKDGSTNSDIKVSLSSCAAICDFAAKNNIGFRGHTFVWHGQMPQWSFKENFDQNANWVSKDVMNTRMDSYIHNMFDAYAQQYPTMRLIAYDVCNECVSDDSNRTKNNGGARVPGWGDGKSP